MKAKNYLEMISSIRESLLASWGLTLQFGDFKLEVMTNSPEVQKGLQDYFQSFLTAKAEEPHCRITVHQAPVLQFPDEFQAKPPDLGQKQDQRGVLRAWTGKDCKKKAHRHCTPHSARRASGRGTMPGEPESDYQFYQQSFY
ncbi:MAG: hypothetical protein U5J62_05725 [Desulfurivibrio sp.]|nr:hypothetical protein [Desulfurivibrio sp.]